MSVKKASRHRGIVASWHRGIEKEKDGARHWAPTPMKSGQVESGSPLRLDIRKMARLGGSSTSWHSGDNTGVQASYGEQAVKLALLPIFTADRN